MIYFTADFYFQFDRVSLKETSMITQALNFNMLHKFPNKEILCHHDRLFVPVPMIYNFFFRQFLCRSFSETAFQYYCNLFFLVSSLLTCFSLLLTYFLLNFFLFLDLSSIQKLQHACLVECMRTLQPFWILGACTKWKEGNMSSSVDTPLTYMFLIRHE